MSQEVKDANQSKWYKRMYDTIHKQKPHRGNKKILFKFKTKFYLFIFR